MTDGEEASKNRDRYLVSGKVSSFGKFIVISNETFLDPALKKRIGTEEDVKKLEETFSRFGFDFKNNIHRNLTTPQMLKLMINVAREGLTKYNCLAIAIMTHGHDNGSICGAGPTGDVISLDALFKPLKTAMDIDGKPKLIFIQACRGDNLDDGKKIVHDAPLTDLNPQRQKFISIPLEADFLYHFATSPGYCSFRNSHGSAFIQSLCKVASEYLKESEKSEIDVMKMLTRVNREVAEQFSSCIPSQQRFHDKKQMPCVLSMLRKELYLSPKKS